MIDLKELIILSLEQLKGSLVRTALTMLGIVIGIASVITIISLGDGSTQSIVDQISAFGTNIITISPGQARRGPGSSGGTFDTLTQKDADAIADLANIETVSAVVSSQATLVKDSNSLSTSVSAVDKNYATAQSLEFSQGQFFSDSQASGMSKYLILGDQLLEELFYEDAQVVGEKIRLNGKTFKIIGVIEGSGSVLVPLATGQKVLFGHTYLSSISVKVVDNTLMEQTTTDIENLLLSRHQISNPDNADFNLRNALEMIDNVSSMTATLTTVLGGIAAISLLVGGIGIMNIMLVTVTERTRDIGLLKAIGAKPKDILSQFLIESLVLTLAGGFFGVVIGGLLTYFASSAMSIPFVISAKSIILAVTVSAGVGVLFGWYPAKKASALHPIDALRYE